MQQRVSNLSNPEFHAIFNDNDSLPLCLVHSRTSAVLSPLVVCSLRLVVSTVKSFAPFHVLNRDFFREVSPRASDNYFGASIRGYSTRAIRLSYLIGSLFHVETCGPRQKPYTACKLCAVRGSNAGSVGMGTPSEKFRPEPQGICASKHLFRGLHLRVFYPSNTRISLLITLTISWL